MKIVICLFYVAALTLAIPFDSPRAIQDRQVTENGELLSRARIGPGRRQGGTYAITGIPNGKGGDGSVPFRVEIRQLQSNTDRWNLYLLGLDQLQRTTSQTAQLSHYQLSGIHGQPYVPWDGVQATAGDENSGYCTHSSILFPTWHRPYLALYEQVLYNTIQSIVKQFPNKADRDRYTIAASTFRIPYWDWAASPPNGQSVLPSAVTVPTVTVHAPSGTTTIDNPLFAYKFHPNSNELGYFSMWKTTLRYPNDTQSDAHSQNNLVAQQLDNSRLAMRDRLYNLLTSDSNYSTFSNEAWIPNEGGSYDSLESLHDMVHVLTGNGGHMAYVNVAAFDPIFYLHHATIDRAFAMWQALYPNSYVEPTASKYGTFTTTPGQIEDINTGLTPFHSDTSGDLWTSARVRSTGQFSYSYPELPYWTEAANPSAYLAAVRSKINNLYGHTAPSSVTKRSPGQLSSFPLLQRESPEDPTKQNTPQNVTTSGDKYREWIANMKVQKFALSGSFFVHIFLGDFTSDPAQWSFDPNLVGSHAFFTASRDCRKCRNLGNIQVAGCIPLTTALLAAIQNGYLDSLQPSDVEPYLRENLHWRVTLLDDTAVQADQVPGLVVSVVSAEVTKGKSNSDFPQWGSFNVHASITDSRPAGLPAGGEY